MLFLFITLFGIFLPDYGFMYPLTLGDSVYVSMGIGMTMDITDSDWRLRLPFPVPDSIIPIAGMRITDDFSQYPVRMYFLCAKRTPKLERALVDALRCYIKLLDTVEWNEQFFPGKYLEYMELFGRPESAAFMWNCMVYLVERDKLYGHDLVPAPDTSFQSLNQG